MSRMTRRTLLGAGLLSVPGLMVPAAFGQDKVVQPGQPVVITVTTAAPTPDVSLVLGKREAKMTPCRVGCTHTGGGNIDVQQPSPDTLVVTMTGVAVAYGSPAGAASAGLDFALSQAFEVSFDKPTVKAAKLTMEARVIGFLRSHKLGTAEESGSAVVGGAAGGPGLTLAVPSHSVAAGESVSINDKEGPVGLIVPAAGPLCLTQTFRVAASMPRSVLPCKAPSAEFAPDPALDPFWISAREPFHGAVKKDLGFQVVIKVASAELPEPKNGKK
jgi:antitoxin (DNA-binding transcriptional repressor) of toxin-antitoxin stability system